MQKIYKPSDYIEMLYDIRNLNTYYGYGACGAPADYKYTGRTYKTNRERYNAPGAPAGSFLFDCAGFAYKAIPWGFRADQHKCYGGATWPAPGQPFSELDTNDVLSICTDVSEDFSNIRPSEVLYIPGHVGVYVGEGIALECTTGWNADEVIETVVLNVRKEDPFLNSRTWQKHGKLPFIDYEEGNAINDELIAAVESIERASAELVKISGDLDRAHDIINTFMKGVFK